ncbi:TPA: hypothetical protein I9092_002176 [Clostridium perfringens]|nr:hypothetical protein [Clostridium perfringens]
MILSDVSKRIIKSDNLKEVIAIFEKAMGGKNEINVKVGEFNGEICYEIEIMSEEAKKYFETITKYKVNNEYFDFLGKVCTYYGYSLDNLKEKLIPDKEKRNMWGNKDE